MSIAIGICGNFRSGKDSTFAILAKYLPVRRIAFADRLKEVTDDLCWKLYGISSFTQDNSEKETIRPILVAVGNTARTKNERIWIDQTVPLIKEIQVAQLIPVITDVRYPNEVNFVQNENNGMLIHVDKMLGDGTISPPANEFEAENYPILKSRSDVQICASNLEQLEKEVVVKVLPLLVEKVA